MYIKKKTSCEVDWKSDEADPSHCPPNFNFRQRSAKNITEMTGCLPRCKYTKYEFEQLSSEQVTWKTNWTSSLYISPGSPSYKLVLEVYKFEMADLVADFGSYIGLFLGWSVLSFYGGVQACTVGLRKLVMKSKE